MRAAAQLGSAAQSQDRKIDAEKQKPQDSEIKAGKNDQSESGATRIWQSRFQKRLKEKRMTFTGPGAE